MEYRIKLIHTENIFEKKKKVDELINKRSEI